MAILNFPSNPSVDETYEENGVLYTWDGVKWTANSTQSFLPITGGELTGDLTVPSLNGGPLAGFRNVLINGLMAIEQRGNSGATLANNDIYTRDRWQTITQGSGGSVTVDRSGVNLNSAPNVDGAADALIYTTTAPLSQGASTNIYLSQKIEGKNFRAMCGWIGNTTDRPITLSFWVKSSVAGTYSISLLRDPTGIGTSNLLTYVADYTIDAVDTWEKKVITITAPADVGASITSYVDLSFHVWGGSSRRATSTGWQDAANAVAVVSPNYNANWGNNIGQTFEITAIQLEPGPVATPFEHRPIGTELALCQRYYQSKYQLSMPGTTTQTEATIVTQTAMRAAPTVENLNIISGSFAFVAGKQRGNLTVVDLRYTPATNSGNTTAGANFDLNAEL